MKKAVVVYAKCQRIYTVYCITSVKYYYCYTKGLFFPKFPLELLLKVNTCCIFSYFLLQMNASLFLFFLHLSSEVKVNNKDDWNCLAKEWGRWVSCESCISAAFSSKSWKLFRPYSLSLIFNMFVTFSPPLQQWHCSRSSPIVLKHSLSVKLLLLLLARRHGLF